MGNLSSKGLSTVSQPSTPVVKRGSTTKGGESHAIPSADGFQSPDPVKASFKSLIRSWTPSSRTNSFAFSPQQEGFTSPTRPSSSSKKKTGIDFSGKNLRKLDWKKFRWATIVKLRSNQLTVVSEDIELFQGLEILDLSENRLAELPRVMGNLTNLTHLYLASNRLFFAPIPKELGNLHRLKLLDLSSNELNTLPDELSEMTVLAYLDLSRNDFKELPACVVRFTSLQVLKIGFNKLRELPDSLGDLDMLRVSRR
jgi:Leucine-rich repeat (LRR) protein